MDRYTVKNEAGYHIPDEFAGKAIQRLGEFEDAFEDLMNSQAQIPMELENMRMQGKEKTVRYKETVAQKLINNNIIMFFERHGFKSV